MEAEGLIESPDDISTPEQTLAEEAECEDVDGDEEEGQEDFIHSAAVPKQNGANENEDVKEADENVES